MEWQEFKSPKNERLQLETLAPKTDKEARIQCSAKQKMERNLGAGCILQVRNGGREGELGGGKLLLFIFLLYRDLHLPRRKWGEFLPK